MPPTSRRIGRIQSLARPRQFVTPLPQTEGGKGRFVAGLNTLATSNESCDYSSCIITDRRLPRFSTECHGRCVPAIPVLHLPSDETLQFRQAHSHTGSLFPSESKPCRSHMTFREGKPVRRGNCLWPFSPPPIQPHFSPFSSLQHRARENMPSPARCNNAQ